MSYCTLEEANVFFQTRLNADAWDDASTDAEENKTKALETASRAMDRLNYKGDKSVTDQEHQFPRGGDTAVPQDMIIACCEEALSLLEGRDPVMEQEGLRMFTQTYANVKAGYDTKVPVEHIVNGITSPIAWRYIKPFLRGTLSPQLLRV